MSERQFPGVKFFSGNSDRSRDQDPTGRTGFDRRPTVDHRYQGGDSESLKLKHQRFLYPKILFIK